MWNYLFDTSNWPPRWRCGIWSEAMGYTTIISELAIWGAYMAIPLILVYFIRKRKDIPFHGIFILFALFIVACGFTHFIEAIIFYFPVYRFLTLVLIGTALVSWGTAFALIPVIPKVLNLPSLEKVNQILREDLGSTNERLEKALETMRAGVWDWNLKTEDMIFSDSLSDFLRLPRQKTQRPPSNFFEKIYFEDKDKIEHAIRDNLRSDHVQSIRFRMLVQENQVINTHLNWKVLFDDSHQPVRIIGTVIFQNNLPI